MDTILIALAFVGGLTGMIIVGMLVTLYFYAHDALRLRRSRGVQSLRTITGRSVPVQVNTGAGRSEINLGLSTGPGTRYAWGGLMVMVCFILVMVIAFISVLSTSLH